MALTTTAAKVLVVIMTTSATANFHDPRRAAGCAAVLFAAYSGRMPDESVGDRHSLERIGINVILVAAALLLSGKSIERLLEMLCWGLPCCFLSS
jgi:hypothetical protein